MSRSAISISAMLAVMMAYPCAFNAAGQSVGSEAVLQPAMAAPGLPVFAVSTIKLDTRNDGRWKLAPTDDGCVARGVTLHELIQEGYGVYQDDRIVGDSGWSRTQRYDLEAKVDGSDLQRLARLDMQQRRLMLRALLADRFKLAAHTEARERPIYALIVAKNGPRLEGSKPENMPPDTIKGTSGLVTRSIPGEIAVEWMTMDGLAQMLTPRVDRIVVDKTGLTARYNFKLDWSPEEAAGAGANDAPMPSAPAGPSIFTALQEQLGLKLEAQKGPVEVVVIDHIEPPSEN